MSVRSAFWPAVWPAVLALLVCAGALPAFAKAPPLNANLYTTYAFATGNASISWVTCGATQQSEGCFGSGQLTGFGSACAALEGKPQIRGDTVTEYVYILDSKVPHGSTLVLDVYKKTDVITASYDTTTFTLANQVDLGVPTGAKATCFAAADPLYVFAGTSVGDNAVRISKADLSLASVGGFSPPSPVSAIDADSRGYVSVQFGGNAGFYLFSPDGNEVEDGGGSAAVFNQENAFKP